MIILKIGGGAGINLEAIVADLAALPEPYIIVHGANSLRNQLAEKLGIRRRVLTSLSGVDSVYTDADAIDLLMMAYAGLANKRLVALCQRQGINAVGLSGLDGRMVVGKRNAGIRIRQNGKNILVHDFSGKPVSINQPLLDLLLEHGYVPVLSVPILDEGSIALNSENDDVVALLQRCFRATTVIHLIEAQGLLSDADRRDSVIARMSAADVTEALPQTKGRMKRKLLSISRLFEHGVKRVIIADGRVGNPISRALTEKGTVIS